MTRTHQALVAIVTMTILVLTGCTNNFFSSLDEPDPGPSAADLRNIYNDPDATAAERMDAASRAGTQTIVDNDDALQTVTNFSNVIATLTNSEDGEISSEQIISDLFPDNMSDEEAGAMIDTFLAAAGDFSAFAAATGDLGDDEDPLNSGEKGDTVQMAVISLAIEKVLAAGGDTDDPNNPNRQALIDLATGSKSPEDITFSGSADAFENLGADDGSDLGNLIQYAGLGDTF
ncbi:MAG: hypothetical protein WD492_01170 [Alkalispirochaeta sp.]